MNSAPFVGDPAGFGGDQPGAGDLAIGELAGADLEGLDRAVHRRFAEPAGLADPLAQPDDAGKRVDDAEAALARHGDQQAAIVGAEVEGAVEERGLAPGLGLRGSGTAAAIGRGAGLPGAVGRGIGGRPGAGRIDRTSPLAPAFPRFAGSGGGLLRDGNIRLRRIARRRCKVPAVPNRTGSPTRRRVQRIAARRLHLFACDRAPARRAAARLHVSVSPTSLSGVR